MKNYWVYILRCSDGSYYTGVTNDLERRVFQHNAGVGGKYTKSRRPVKLVFTQDFGNVLDAIAAEKQIKGWRRSKKEALIAGDWDKIVELSNLRKQ